MKKLLPIGLMALISISGYASPAKKGLRTYRQADGTTITLNLTGDEHFHSFVTTDGLAVSKKADGNYYYRTAEGVSEIIAHNEGLRDAAETSFIKANFEGMNVSRIAKAAKANGTMRKAARRVAKGASQVPSSGSPKVPILLVQYKDYKFKDNDAKATFTNFFSQGETSAYQYFVDQSNGKYTPQFDIYGPVTLSGNRATYGGNDYWGNDQGVGKMVGEACTLLNSDIDFSQYDNNNDGECDVIIVLYAGDGEASSYDEDSADSVWPCQWELSSSDYGKSLTYDGTKIDKFAVFNELYGSDLTQIDGIGTFCHEFSHCLDLPDFYDTQYGPHFGMGPWSLMDYGSYNDNGYTPVGYSAYEKAFMKWIDLEEATENTFNTLPVFNQKNLETDKAIKITNSQNSNEYYVLENRAKQGWDKYLYSEGLMITHVTYSESVWAANTVNDTDTQHMTIIPADNSLKLEKGYDEYGNTYYSFDETDVYGDLWPSAKATELTDTSTPAATVNTGKFMGKPVTEITKNDDGTISFWTMKSPLPSVATPINVSHELVSSTSATIKWDAAENDTEVTYTVEVSKYEEPTYELVSTTDFTEDNDWTQTGSVNQTNDEIYLGSNKKTGAFTSPVFTTGEDGVVTVKLNAKYYGSDNSSVKVSLIDASKETIASKTISLTSDYADYDILLNGTANAKTYVRIETVASKKRVYVKTAEIYKGDASGELNDTNTTTYSGLTETSLTLTNLEENGTYNYRVKAVPVDQENYAASAWSEKKQFTLSDMTAVSTIDTAATSAEYFTLQGVRVNGTPTTPGIYIRRQGGKVAKIMVK